MISPPSTKIDCGTNCFGKTNVCNFLIKSSSSINEKVSSNQVLIVFSLGNGHWNFHEPTFTIFRITNFVIFALRLSLFLPSHKEKKHDQIQSNFL